MKVSCGLVGLPNVGKSTIFNVLTETELAETGDYPFCTIKPNRSFVRILDKRVDRIADISASQKKIYSRIEIVDIAGLIKNAYKGEGLGNQFLDQISQTDAIIHVVGCFRKRRNEDIIEDIETIKTELMLADIQMLEKTMQKGDDKKFIGKIIEKLSNNHNLSSEELSAYNFLSQKPVIYLLNVDDMDFDASFLNLPIVKFSALEEKDALSLNSEERELFLGQNFFSMINNLITSVYSTLNVIDFFTSGEKETRAWQIVQGFNAKSAAGVIHSDFERHFISVEKISYEDFTNFEGYKRCRELGKATIEGKDYVVQSGDVMIFKSYK